MTAIKAQPTPTFKGRPVDVVIDVRSKLEFWLGHLDGAICVPVDVIGERVVHDGTLKKDARILVYCASGARSAAAAGELRRLGYHNVTDGGGMSAAAKDFKSCK